jgi:hypothetical protein
MNPKASNVTERNHAIARGTVPAGLVALALIAAGCHGSPDPNTPIAEDCREGPVDLAGRGLETGAEGAELGVETGASAVKQGVKAAGGFVADGTAGAEDAWNEQKQDTKAEAREGAREVDAASEPPCE